MPVQGRFGGKALTAELRKLAAEVHTVTNDGTPVTREQRLGELIWQQALGWTEESRDDNGTMKKVVHLPVAWAQQYLFERLEGKAPVAVAENDGGMKAADKVRSLAKDRVNALAAKAAVGKPPSYKPKQT
jgi:hypothetical protein